MRQCKNPQCGRMFNPVSSIHSFCSDACRRAIRGSEYRRNRAIRLYLDEYRCTECGSTQHLECHHVTPLYKGGDNSLDNLITLCHKHHRAKHRTYKEKEASLDHERTKRRSEVYYHAA